MRRRAQRKATISVITGLVMPGEQEKMMRKKTIILNGGPRKNWNTAMMLKEAKKGAESVGAETEYIDLFDLSYTGCRSCQVHGLIERLHFCALSYDDYSSYFTGKVDVGIILTMNAPKSFYNLAYRKKAKEVAQSFKELNGSVEVCACCDTLQVADYSKYDMASFNEEHKRAMRENQFPKDLAKAFELGAKLSAEK